MSEFLAILATIDPIAFSIGSLSVRWYGLAYITGIAMAALIVSLLAKRWRVSLTLDDALTMLLGCTIGIIAGGRLGYCFFYEGGYYLTHPLQIFAVWSGGMSFHGGFLGCLLGGYLGARIAKVPPLTFIDLGCVAAPIGIGLGRMTNFINGEAWGRVTTVSWGVVFSAAGSLPRHPSQLYELALEGIVLFAILMILALRTPPPPKGMLFGCFLTLYGVFRITAEFFREPDSFLGFLVGGWFTMGMLLSVPMVIAGIILIAWSMRTRQPSV